MRPYRYDIVGSFLRPDYLKDARTEYAEGTLSADQLREVEDKAIKELVEKEIYYYQSHACQIHLEITSQEFQIDLRKDLQLRYDGKILTLSLQESGYGRDKRCVKINEISEIDIFSDVSSLEIFINHGQKVMTTRVYDSYHDTKIKVSCPMTMDYYELKPYNIIEKKETKI